MKLINLFILLLVCCLLGSRSVSAHPVAQGALTIRIQPEKIQVQARISDEEIFIANTFASSDKPKANTLEDVWQQHGNYFLQYFRMFADKHLLTGHIVSLKPDNNDFVIYQFEFPVKALPTMVRVEEDLLNEIDYAAGNPWEAAFAVRIEQTDQITQESLLSRQQPLSIVCTWQDNTTQAITSGQSLMAKQYFQHGINHILSGYDHLLFIAALVLATATFWDLIKVITAFTLAHTITLTLSILKVVQLSPQVVEPMIAASIVFVAVTNILWPKHSKGWLRLATAFFFGLFHGLGFAGGLVDATEGMTGFKIGLAIITFSLGVEVGHQMVVLPLFVGLKLICTYKADDLNKNRRARTILRSGSLLIALAGSFYLNAAFK